MYAHELKKVASNKSIVSYLSLREYRSSIVPTTREMHIDRCMQTRCFVLGPNYERFIFRIAWHGGRSDSYLRS